MIAAIKMLNLVQGGYLTADKPMGHAMIGRSSENWLGRQGSNLRMAASKAAALPLGDAPTEARL